MSWWRRFLSRNRREQDLDAEIRTHLEAEAQQRIERGESPKDAWANARKDFGNVALVKEVTRQSWSWSLLDGLIEDLRFAFRLCARYPGFSAAVVLILAITIGINVSIFSAMNAVVLRYAVGRRTREICVRMALGAQHREVLKLIFRQAAPPVIGGSILGLAVALALATYAKSQIPFVLFHIRETDRLTYAAVTLLLLAIASLAACIPARRASRMDPASVLRHE